MVMSNIIVDHDLNNIHDGWEFTPTYDGWLHIWATGSSGTSHWLEIVSAFYSDGRYGNAAYTYRMLIPVKRGVKIALYYSGMTLGLVRSIIAEGSSMNKTYIIKY